MRLASCLSGISFVLVAVGCVSSGSDPSIDDIDNGFESDDPSGRLHAANARGGSATDAGASASADSNGTSGNSADAARAVQEADIVKVDGDRLYTLSRYGGLAVIDVSDPDHMRIVGRKRIEGIPFEMYVEGTKAFVMLNDFGHWSEGDGGYGSWVQSSEILTFDVADPAHITQTNQFEVPGSIADSRLVGDVAYVVTYENGYCWGCQKNPATVVTSFELGQAITKRDQLIYAPPSNGSYSWQRSVSATNQRLYIAGPEWSWSGNGAHDSVIQVVDIADPHGKLVKGADVHVGGQINSRWQMDELGGVLRVVSQPQNWGFGSGTENPKLQTFTIVSSQQITPLGQTDIVLPKPESLTSVRFDGTRAYASTSERTDPLFTLDLSAPAAPKQVGSVELPGQLVYMEPHGDRLLGFGYDATRAWDARLAVTLFDVSDPKAPRVLKQASFGAGWGSFAEDQDRIQKSVQVLSERGLILVPFASYGSWWNGACEPGKSGIQLIDYSGDDLVVRGIAPQYGLSRRAFVVKDRLVGMSDQTLTTFDISSRDKPTKTGEIALSNAAYQLLELPDQIASITNDWWSGEAMLSLTPKENADDAQPTGRLSLASLAGADQSYCGNTSTWTSWYAARIFAISPTQLVVTVPVSSYRWDGAKSVSSGKLITATIDITDRRAPRLVAQADLPFLETTWGGYGGWFDGYGFYSYYNAYNASLVGSGQGIVVSGTKLAYLETGWGDTVTRRLHVVDYADPAAPRRFDPIELPASLGSTPLFLDHGVVLTSRWSPSPNHEGKVRFFADRVDLRGAAPVRLSSINTPGSLLTIDEPSGHLVTTDYAVTRRRASSWQECSNMFGWQSWFDYDTNTCVKVDRSFKLSDLDDTRVTLRQSFALPRQNLGGVTIADDRIYVTRFRQYDYARYDAATGFSPIVEDGGLWAIGGIRAGKLAIVSDLAGDVSWPLAASGSKIALYTSRGLAIYDTQTPAPSLLADVPLRAWGYTTSVVMNEHVATAALGEWGLQTARY